jgi:hypothetical protein
MDDAVASSGVLFIPSFTNVSSLIPVFEMENVETNTIQ